MVGGADDECILDDAGRIERVKDPLDAHVERVRAGLVRGHVSSNLRHVGQVRRREHVVRLPRGARLEELAVRLEEAYTEEERLPEPLRQEVNGHRSDVVDVAGIYLDDLVVAYNLGLFGD